MSYFGNGEFSPIRQLKSLEQPSKNLIMDISLKLTSLFRGKLTTCFAGEELYSLL